MAHSVRTSLWWAAALLLAACGRAPDGAGQGGAPAGAMPPMPVSLHRATLQAVPVLVEAVGEAEGARQVELRARVTGVLQKQHYREGEAVRAGTLMFSIERAPFEVALAQQRAALAQEQARVDQARREVDRLASLVQQQMVTRRDADNAASTLQVAQSTLAAAQARVKEAELNLSYTQVTAPISGIAGRAEKSEGSLVSPSDGLLARLTQADPVWVRFSLSESELATLRKSPAAAVSLVAADGRVLVGGGRLNFTGSTVDPRLGTVPLRAEFANPSGAVLPGQFVRVQLQAGEAQAFLVPQAAVMTTEQGRMVWTMQDGKATPTPVQAGGWRGRDWVIQGGLKDGDQVIVDNLIKLRPGAPVAPAQAASAAPAASAASR